MGFKEVLNFGLDLLLVDDSDDNIYDDGIDKKTDMYGDYDEFDCSERFDPMHPAADKNGYVYDTVDY